MTSMRRVDSYYAGSDRGPDVLTSAIRKFPCIPAAKFRAVNDNDPRKSTQMVPYNGGCSTLSGRIPVSVPRVSILDGAERQDEQVAA